MNIKTGPSSAFVGPAVRLQSQAAARPKPFSLESQLEREVEGCVPQVRPNTASSWNRKSSVLLRLVLLFLVLSQIRFAGAADPYAAYSTDTELSPPELNYYIRERNQREAAERQEHFRKRLFHFNGADPSAE